ncbi:hypothetical protein NL533_33045, partial [Klebsiella pneumoniae]|nr:hypothetical protein [Klebsiella pneumoniae]
ASGYATAWHLRSLFGRVILASNPDAHSSRVIVQLAFPKVLILRWLLHERCALSRALIICYKLVEYNKY